jgi:hypothetical protein
MVPPIRPPPGATLIHFTPVDQTSSRHENLPVVGPSRPLQSVFAFPGVAARVEAHLIGAPLWPRHGPLRGPFFVSRMSAAASPRRVAEPGERRRSGRQIDHPPGVRPSSDRLDTRARSPVSPADEIRTHRAWSRGPKAARSARQG